MTDPNVPTPSESFDYLARSLAEDRPSRRRVLSLLVASLFGGTLGSLSLLDHAEGRRGPFLGFLILPPPAPPGTEIACPNITLPCGLGSGPLACRCRLTKEGQQVCLNVVEPPNEVSFTHCQTTVNCPDGQVCDAFGSVCRFS